MMLLLRFAVVRTSSIRPRSRVAVSRLQSQIGSDRIRKILHDVCAFDDSYIHVTHNLDGVPYVYASIAICMLRAVLWMPPSDGQSIAPIFLGSDYNQSAAHKGYEPLCLAS